MYKVEIKIDVDTYVFEGNDAYEIYDQLDKIQSINGFVSACYSYGCEIDSDPLDAMEAFVAKYDNKTLTMDDIRNLDIHTTTGDISVKQVLEV